MKPDELKPCPFCGDMLRLVVFTGGGRVGPRCFRHCPFCGAADDWLRVVTGHRCYYVQCQRCRGEGGDRNTAEQAIKAWNKRTEAK